MIKKKSKLIGDWGFEPGSDSRFRAVAQFQIARRANSVIDLINFEWTMFNYSSHISLDLKG
jgi:hypothetical protein